LKGLDLVRFVSHLTWSDEEVLAVIHGSSDEIAKVDLQHGVLESLYKSPVPIAWLGVQPPSTVMFATADGVFLELKGRDDVRVLFTIAASDPYDVKFSGEHVLALTGGQELFMDGHSLANSVTSYTISDDVCIYTTLQNKLHLISLTTRKQLGAVEFPHPTIPSTAPIRSPVQKITVEEIEAALKKINQCGFVAGCGTVDAIQAARLLIEKHREKQRLVHIAFLDLEKAFDRVPREVIWYALRSDELIERVWCNRLERFGLGLNLKKTEYLTTGVTESSSIKVNGIELPRTSVFKYLGSAIASDGKPMVGRHGDEDAALDGWSHARGPHPKRCHSEKFGVAPIADKMREARLRWYGHVLCGKEDSVRKIERAVELGSRLLASTSGRAVIMQMPRGNLETIHPRPFVTRVIKELIDSEKYIEALKEMKKHRIDMNLLVDHKPEVFIANISKLVQSAKDPELICILIAALTSERSALCDGIVISNKINRVTELLADEILRLPLDRRVDMFVALLSALLKSSPPQVEKALRLIKQHTDEMPAMKRDVYARKWLHHVRFFVNEAMLFNAALATYDLKLTLQVAEVSNRDPKEYVPLLNELRKVEPEDYRKCRIDMARSDWESALRHLSLFDDKWDEAVDLIRARDLYAPALVIYRGSAKYKSVCALYAAVLEAKAQWDEAAVLYEKAEDISKTMRCLEMSRNVERYMSRAHLFNIPEDVVVSTLKKMAIVLKSSGRWAEAAKALEVANADIFSEMGSTMSMASRRTGKTGVSRASTTATVRKRKQEGGEYEDAALLIALAAYYKWLNDLIGEMTELLPALVQVDELSLAGSLQGSVDRIVSEAATLRHRIWPSKLHPWDLPGPIHALYAVNDSFAFPDGGGMPDVITLEPEIFAPVLDTGRRWKLQILKMGEKTF
uniref:Reverse transcriptase domain-containing protein n=1 Tax=Heligmosomoides polygyrus TaxID=6339 RepID=A0A8L8KT92_HELPZ